MCSAQAYYHNAEGLGTVGACTALSCAVFILTLGDTTVRDTAQWLDKLTSLTTESSNKRQSTRATDDAYALLSKKWSINDTALLHERVNTNGASKKEISGLILTRSQKADTKLDWALHLEKSVLKSPSVIMQSVSSVCIKMSNSSKTLLNSSVA